MSQHAPTTDKQLGFVIVLGLVVLASGATMLIAPGESLGAAGFAVAVVAGLVMIATIHLVDA